MTGQLIAIARKAKGHAPMEIIDSAQVSIKAGIEGDFRGTSALRQVSVMAIEDWTTALGELKGPDLPWTTRRANLLVENFKLPQAIGARFSIGPVILEVTEETEPCSRMEKAYAGLRAALSPDWRGGVCCRVIQGGALTPGDSVAAI
jgi:MOSC domain-containing protein YiiM